MPWVVPVSVIFIRQCDIYQSKVTMGLRPDLKKILGAVIPESTDNILRSAYDEMGLQCSGLWYREIEWKLRPNREVSFTQYLSR